MLRTLFFLFISCTALAQNSSLTGKVIDSDSQQPIPFANVYINRTTFGASTSEDGTYTINGITTGQNEVICSVIGYQTKVVTIHLKPGEKLELNFSLPPLNVNLDEITVEADRDKSWEKNLNEFEKVFLGTDAIASKCRIINPEVLEFAKLVDNGLAAMASRPVEIVNYGLGYKVRYELKAFEKYPDSYKISGNIRFEEMDTSDVVIKRRWNNNRERAYNQSLEKLLKAIIDNRVEDEGYDVFTERVVNAPLARPLFFEHYRASIDPFNRDKFLQKTDSGSYILNVPTRVEVHNKKSQHGKSYRDLSYQVTWIEFLRPLPVSADGVPLDPLAIELMGAMAENRVGNLLPENYRPKKN